MPVLFYSKFWHIIRDAVNKIVLSVNNACQTLKMTKANENDPAHGYKAKGVDAEKGSLMVGYEWLLPSRLI